MKDHYQLTQTLMPDRVAYHYANGKRITKARYEEIFLRGQMHGEVDCFMTKCKQLGNGQFRRVNYVSVRY